MASKAQIRQRILEQVKNIDKPKGVTKDNIANLLTDINENTGAGGSGGGAKEEYSLATQIDTATPAAGEFSFDNVDPSLATVLRVNEIDIHGNNISVSIDTFKPNDELLFVATDDGDIYIDLQLGKYTKSGAVYTFPVTVLRTGGSAIGGMRFAAIYSNINLPNWEELLKFEVGDKDKLEDVKAKSHVHANGDELDKFETGDKNKLDDASAKSHVHANGSDLDKITTEDISNIQDGFTKGYKQYRMIANDTQPGVGEFSHWFDLDGDGSNKEGFKINENILSGNNYVADILSELNKGDALNVRDSGDMGKNALFSLGQKPVNEGNGVWNFYVDESINEHRLTVGNEHWIDFKFVSWTWLNDKSEIEVGDDHTINVNGPMVVKSMTGSSGDFSMIVRNGKVFFTPINNGGTKVVNLEGNTPANNNSSSSTGYRTIHTIPVTENSKAGESVLFSVTIPFSIGAWGNYSCALFYGGTKLDEVTVNMTGITTSTFRLSGSANIDLVNGGNFTIQVKKSIAAPYIFNCKAGAYSIIYQSSTPAPVDPTSFTDLLDTPNSYAGQAKKAVVVNDAEDGVEFKTISSGGGSGFKLQVVPVVGATTVVDLDSGNKVQLVLTGVDSTISFNNITNHEQVQIIVQQGSTACTVTLDAKVIGSEGRDISQMINRAKDSITVINGTTLLDSIRVTDVSYH